MKMHYSRRELYAAGEPIGDSATYRKADGGLILGDGGGQPSQSPVTQQTQISDLPDWAKGYAQNVLAKGQALTEQKYQPYTQQRIAGFTPLQEQAFQGAANLGPTAQTAMGSGLAAAAGAGALGTGYQAGQFSGGRFTPRAAQQYMNPFVESSLAPQIALAQQEQGRQAAQMAGQATQAGAFGGSRFGVQQAQQNLNNQLALQNLVGQGYNTAYQQAQNQFNQDMARRMQAQQLGEQSRQFGAGLGMQGLQTGLQAASTLGGLGQQQFAQQQGAIQAQATAGQQQQALQQKSLDTAYQDYLTQLNYPYQQLSYMSNLVRGTPMGMSTTSQVYQPGPTGMQTLGALGLGAYGASKLFAAEGGLMKGYAGGGMVSFDDGGSVGSGLGIIDKFNDQGAMASSMYNLSDAQLQDILQHPTTQAEAVAAQQELNRRQEAMMASERQGMAGAYNQLPYSTQERMVRAAGGGILAFKDGDAVEDNDGPTQQDMAEALYGGRIADPNLQRQLMRRQMGITDYLLGRPTYKAPTKEERMRGITEYIGDMQKYGGESPYGGMNEYIQQQLGDLAKEREEGKGIAALEAIPAILQPGGALRGFGAAAASLGGSYAKLAQSQRTAKGQLMNMQFNLKDAERKERMGLYRDARASQAEAERNAIAADKADRESKAAAGNIIAKTMQANRVVGGGGAGAGNKEWTYATKTYLPLAKQEHPGASPAELEAYAYQMYQQGRGPGLAGAQGRIESAEQKNKEDQVKDDLFANREYRQAKRKGDTDTTDRIENAARQRRGLPPLGGATPAPTKKPSVDEWMAAARKANPGVSDADLKAYYSANYK